MSSMCLLQKILVWTLTLNALIPGATGVSGVLIPLMVDTLMGLAGIGFSVYNALTCDYLECCDERWIVPRTDKLSSELERNVYGQHLAIEVITRKLREHTRTTHPEKTLVLSMHGWTGTGKNYVSQFIINNLYREGDKSKFVHLFVTTEHFPYKNQVHKYKEYLKSYIKQAMEVCPRSIFVFDEVEKMPPGLIHFIVPYLRRYVFNKPDFTKAIFLFLSNSAGTDVNNRVSEHLIAGHKREDLTLQEMEDVIKAAAFRESLWYADLLENGLITVPFLPLERKHVKACVRDEMIKRFLDAYVSQNKENFVNRVADEMRYFPDDSKLFSTSGCKRVSEKVNLILED